MALQIEDDKAKKSLIDPTLHIQMFNMTKQLTSVKMYDFLGFIRMMMFDIQGEADSSVLFKSKKKAEAEYTLSITNGA